MNLFLSENKKNFCCIIAGYEEELNKCFFSMNKGLERRFQWVHKIDTYTHKELTIMLLHKLKDEHWKISIPITSLLQMMEKHVSFFKNMGGDIEKFITNIKLVHAKRVFSLDSNHKKIITEDDINEAFRIVKENCLSTQPSNPLPNLYI